ncbi:MAG: Gfo/Idh/MocA family protein [Candidatus Thorarchaeota archaeon]
MKTKTRPYMLSPLIDEYIERGLPDHIYQMSSDQINMERPVCIVIVGAGDRGTVYSKYAIEHPERAQVVGVAEPIAIQRQRMVEKHGIPEENVFSDWKGIAEKGRIADAAIIATQDSMHVEPTIALAKRGYSILLEKPMAPDEKGCRQITDAVLANNVIFAVGHVLRYTRYTQKLKALIDEGTIGDIVSLQRLEPVGYWHQAHSFVRGNWRKEEQSSSMLLAKSCHDIDWIRHIVGKRCKTVSSFGSLTHFHKANKPSEAGELCIACDYEPRCPYSAKKIYLGFIERGITGWPVSVITPEVSHENVMSVLKTGPYGRCVYDCDNDVVDHQVVNMEFEDGETASFTMTAFTKARQRETRVFGTRGEIYGNGTDIHVYDFLTDETVVIDTTSPTPSALEDHGGGDYWLIHSFISAVAENDPSLILSGPEETPRGNA